jgi:hypothetical protein
MKLNYRRKRTFKLTDVVWVVVYTATTVGLCFMTAESIHHRGWPWWFTCPLLLASGAGLWIHATELLDPQVWS